MVILILYIFYNIYNIKLIKHLFNHPQLFFSLEKDIVDIAHNYVRQNVNVNFIMLIWIII